MQAPNETAKSPYAGDAALAEDAAKVTATLEALAAELPHGLVGLSPVTAQMALVELAAGAPGLFRQTLAEAAASAVSGEAAPEEGLSGLLRQLALAAFGEISPADGALPPLLQALEAVDHNRDAVAQAAVPASKVSGDEVDFTLLPLETLLQLLVSGGNRSRPEIDRAQGKPDIPSTDVLPGMDAPTPLSADFANLDLGALLQLPLSGIRYAPLETQAGPTTGQGGGAATGPVALTLPPVPLGGGVGLVAFDPGQPVSGLPVSPPLDGVPPPPAGTGGPQAEGQPAAGAGQGADPGNGNAGDNGNAGGNGNADPGNGNANAGGNGNGNANPGNGNANAGGNGNADPQTGDDAASTAVGAAVTIAVLANDTDADGDELAVASVTQGANGAAAINADGTVTYTPAAGTYGADSFGYTATDGNGGAASATVFVQVGNVIEGTAGDDILKGTSPNGDVILGHDGNDDINGKNGADMLLGGAGNDLLRGQVGADQLYGEAGDDVLVWDANDTVIDGGPGFDTLLASGGNTIDLAGFAGAAQGLERVDLGAPGKDTLLLTAKDVLDLSDTDVLTVDGTKIDAVNAGSGWSDGGVVGGYHIFSKLVGDATATLALDTDLKTNADLLS